MAEDVAAAACRSLDQEQKGKDGCRAEVKDIVQDEKMAYEEEEVKPDETIHENALGKWLIRVFNNNSKNIIVISRKFFD